MGTINEKISYLNQTKQRQKTLINALGGNITNDTPFREYEKELVGVLPKVTGEGTNISLSPTIEYDLEVESYKGDTTQNTLTGKNLLAPTESFNEVKNGITYTGNNGTYTLKGTSTANGATTYYNIENYTIQDNDYLHVMNTGTATSNIALVFNCTDDTNISIALSPNNRIWGLGLSVGKTIRKMFFYANSGTTIEATLTPMLLHGTSTATSYEPYCGGIPSPNPNYPQNIQVVTETQEVEIANKNTYKGTNKTVTVNGVTIQAKDNGSTLVFNGTATSTGVNIIETTALFNDLIKGQTVSYSLTASNSTNTYRCWLGYFDSNGTAFNVLNGSIPSTDQTGNVKVQNFTCPTGAYKYRTVVGVVSGQTYNNFEVKIQLELGSTSTTYSPYTSQTYTLHLGDLELAKIGSYQDKIYYDNGKWYKKEQIWKFDTTYLNNASWNLTTNTNYSAFWISNSMLTRTQKYSNLFSYKNTSFREVQENAICENSVPTPNLLIFNTNVVTTTEDWKTWLVANNLVVYGVKSVSNDIEITNETLLSDLNNIKENAMSYSGTTNISSSGNLPVIISASALKGE